MDLSILSIVELQKLKFRIEKEVEGRNKKQRDQALDEIKSIAAKYGLKLDEVLDSSVMRKSRKVVAKTSGKYAAKSAKKPSEIQFRHPQIPELTWAGGRGRRPNWIKEWEASGRSLEDARVASA